MRLLRNAAAGIPLFLYFDTIKPKHMATSRMQQLDSIDAYIAAQPQEQQPALQKLRELIRKAAPKAEEGISYGMPTFKYRGSPLVYFAAFKHHYSFFPQPKAIEAFKAELAAYDTAKGTIRLPHDKPLPAKLLTAIVKFRVKENEEKAERKSQAKPSKAKA